MFGGVLQCHVEAEQEAEASGNVPPPPLQIVISTPFLSVSHFSLSPSSHCSLSQSSLSFPFSHFPYPLNHPFFLTILCPPKIKTSSFIQLVYLAKHHKHMGPVLYQTLVHPVTQSTILKMATSI